MSGYLEVDDGILEGERQRAVYKCDRSIKPFEDPEVGEQKTNPAKGTRACKKAEIDHIQIAKTSWLDIYEALSIEGDLIPEAKVEWPGSSFGSVEQRRWQRGSVESAVSRLRVPGFRLFLKGQISVPELSILNAVRKSLSILGA